MLHIKLIAVGKCRESYYAAACREYQKRMGRFAKLSVIEVPDERAPDSLSPAQQEQVRRAEGERILAKIAPEERVVALCIDGKRHDSLGWAAHWCEQMNRGAGKWCFVIGGSLGLSQEVRKRADEKLSFSDFTFCHQLMRVVLLEQIYRAMKILNAEAYHK